MTALALFGVVVLHATWIAAAIAAVVAIGLRWIGAERPWLRHALALAGFLTIAPAALAFAAGPRLVEEAAAVGVGASPAAAEVAATISLAPVLPWIGLVWLVGAAWGLLGLAVAVVQIGEIRRGARPLPVAEAERLLARARREVGYRGSVELALSDRVGVPTLIGWRRPLCALPAATRTSDADLELLLVHELAHVRRADIAWNWAQSLAEALLFFHPAARWLARQIRDERECCCDAVVARTPGALAPYVHALTRLVMAGPTPGPALSATGGSLVSRIERLIEPGAAAAPSWNRCLLLALAAVAAGGVLVACETEEVETGAREVAAPAPVIAEQAEAAVVGGEPQTAAPQARRIVDPFGNELVLTPVNAGGAEAANEAASETRYLLEPGPWLDDVALNNGTDGC
ncbi:MAG: M56 family metallopeptidase [Myxococcales bacterium]|nr:M56 family metallopeptidase [Myxococcales bacterium]